MNISCQYARSHPAVAIVEEVLLDTIAQVVSHFFVAKTEHVSSVQRIIRNTLSDGCALLLDYGFAAMCVVKCCIKNTGDGLTSKKDSLHKQENLSIVVMYVNGRQCFYQASNRLHI